MITYSEVDGLYLRPICPEGNCTAEIKKELLKQTLRFGGYN